MELITRKMIGKQAYSFVCGGQNLHECVMELEKLSFPDVPHCGLCKSDDLVLTAYLTKEENFKYTKIRCRNCGGGLTFGQRKQDPNVFYLRKGEDGKPEWKEAESQENGNGNSK